MAFLCSRYELKNDERINKIPPAVLGNSLVQHASCSS
jgi:hypothetical protein